jgi:hypothetical protein
MTTISVRADDSSYAYQFVSISPSPPPTLYPLSGHLPGGRQLVHSITVIIEHDEEEVVVTEPRFHMHAAGPTEAEALAAFRRIFSGYLDMLTRREKTLGQPLRDQLAYLRSVIVSE